MGALRIDFPTQLPLEEKKARLQALGEYLGTRHGIRVTWSGDTADVKGKYLVVSVEGKLWFEPGKAIFEGKDPGFLWRGKAKDYLEGKLRTYLDPGTKLEDLKRS